MKTRYATLLCAVLLAVSPAGAGEGKTVELEPRGLAGVLTTLAPSDVKEGRVSLDDGVVRSHRAVSFPQRDVSTQSFPVGPHEGEITCDLGKRRFTLELGGETYELDEYGNGLKPILVKLPDGGKTALAFPRARRSKYGSYVFYRSGVTMRGKLGETKLYFYDDDLDLNYAVGEDAVRTGEGLVYAPLREYISLGRSIARITGVDETGASFTAQRYTGEKGTIGVRFAENGRIHYDCAFGSADGKVAFTCSEDKATFLVPPGEYDVLHGLVWREKRGQPYAIAGVLPPAEGATPVAIKAGDKAAIVLGEDLTLHFETRLGKKDFAIPVSSLKVAGKQGERYVGYKWSKEPDVYVVEGKNANKIGGFEYG